MSNDVSMDQPLRDPRLAFFSGLLGYLEDRKWALERVCTAPHGSNLFDLRVSHRLYFQSLLSAIDHVRDFLQDRKDLLDRFDAAIRNGNDYFEYVRELRNAVLHRGLDLVGAAHSDNHTLSVICPRDIENQRRTKIFQPPFKYLRELAAYCESVCNPAVTEVLTALGLFDPATHIVGNDHFETFIRTNPDIPEVIKDSAIAQMRSLSPGVFADMAADRVHRMKVLLGLES